MPKSFGPPNRILVPVDASASSLLGQEIAAAIAKKTGASVTVVHVMQETPSAFSLPTPIETELRGMIEQRAQAIVNNARKLFEEEGVSVETETMASGDVADSILRFSENNYDLIVMGAHGEIQQETFALGGVTKRVMMHTTCPLLIAKKPSTLSNLLVNVDGSESAFKALGFAVKLAKTMNSRITLFNVQERKLLELSEKTARSVGEKILSDALSSIKEEPLKIDKRLEFGVPQDKIVEAAEKGSHDLVVLGRKGYGTVKRFLLGSVTDDVCHKARTSILIVPKT